MTVETTTRHLTRTLRPTPRQRVEAAISVVTPLAWALLVVGVVALVVGRRVGWEELTVLGVTALVALAACAAFTIGQPKLAVRVDVRPTRVPAGGRSAAAVTVARASGGRLLGVDMELGVGDGVAEFRVPSLGPQSIHEEVFILPTRRRAIIPVGPATSVRGDPLGLLRRVRGWTEPEPLFVHPRTVALAELGSGFVRDLEGKPTRDVSPADVAFNTMREYEPGDDRRFIHWMTTARVGKMMVRQFVDTRRSHVGIAIDGTLAAYPDDDDFELAVSAAASLGVRVLREEQDLSVVACGSRVPGGAGNLMLDHLAGIDLVARGRGLAAEADLLTKVASGFSIVMLVTGAATSVADLRAAAVRFPLDVRVLLVRVDPEGETGFRPLGDALLLTLSRLDEMGRLLRSVAS